MEWKAILEATVHPYRWNDHADDHDDHDDGGHYRNWGKIWRKNNNWSVLFDRGRVSWLRLAPRTDHWKKRLPPSLNQWLQPPGAESLSEFTSLGDLSLINSDSSDSRHPCGDFSGGSDPLLVISAPEDLGKSVIRKNFEEILKTCFDDTQFCDFL